MLMPPMPIDESSRQAALDQLGILDTAPDQLLDQLTAMACELLKVDIALVSLIDRDRQWFKSRFGLSVTETGRDISFCGHAVAHNAPLEVIDTHQDERFFDNPLVTGPPFIRAYFGVPLRPLNQQPVGTFCLLHSQPHQLDESQRDLLNVLATQAEVLLKHHYDLQQLRFTQEQHQYTIARYQGLLSQTSAGVMRLDHQGYIRGCNPAAGQFFNVAEPQLQGQAFLSLLEVDAPDHPLRRALHLQDMAAMKAGCQCYTSPTQGERRPLFISLSRIDIPGYEQPEFIVVLQDVSETEAAYKQLHQEQQLLTVLHQGLTDYQRLMSENQLWAFLRDALRTLTDSDYALIGEVLTPLGRPVLKVHAITDLSWSPESRSLMHKLEAGDMLLENVSTMLGRVFAGGETVISSDMQQDDRHCHLPDGHPQLSNYMGVPILDKGKVIGMYAIANSRKPLNMALVTWLEPFNATCALLINLYRQMSEREQFMQALKTARDEQARTSQAKSDFLSMMSHELRTPLNAIIGFSELLLEDPQTLTPSQQTQIDHIRESGQQLLTEINDVLDLSRVEAGRMRFDCRYFELAPLLHSVSAGMSSIAKSYQVQLCPPVCPERLGVYADPRRLRQIMVNLLSNAIKYNCPGGDVKVAVHPLSFSRIRIVVSDNGPGLEPEEQDNLFQPFNRLNQDAGQIEGSGVGLALSRKMAVGMEGDIGVDSLPGQGCDFWVELSTQAPQGGGATLKETSTKEASTLLMEQSRLNEQTLLSSAGGRLAWAGIERGPDAVGREETSSDDGRSEGASSAEVMAHGLLNKTTRVMGYLSTNPAHRRLIEDLACEFPELQWEFLTVETLTARRVAPLDVLLVSVADQSLLPSDLDYSSLEACVLLDSDCLEETLKEDFFYKSAMADQNSVSGQDSVADDGSAAHKGRFETLPWPLTQDMLNTWLWRLDARSSH
ncbi:hypothetical protein BFW38_13725 [Terasakiispira papahanaumokuakeensis]|uniref:histidine kinase n=1 Tax=Terasakiispira papahanaumokuakeensis TaxID=197479 RepID=A0A1E2VBV0_9GAMM|nr:GAF domain-containing protein [Terasakiispira papahanaumokuakeensis]ODC04433.1 hypothetical protein BFW38_13725 [Terasakiispira papahanaumokuakeensis]